LIRIVSYLFIGIGALLLILSIFYARAINLALPLVFLMLGGTFFILVFVLLKRWSWATLLYIPGCILLMFGLVFLLNVITDDWKAWAYAWFLILAGLGLGLVLANIEKQWRPEMTLAGWGLIAAGLTLFALFGAIAGGLFIKIMAPIMLVAGGLLLRLLHPEAILPERILARINAVFPHISVPANAADHNGAVPNGQVSLVEQLSTRELEVLRLVDQGLSNPEIATRLVLASSTVKTHINNIYGKLGVQTRVQAIKRARDLGLIE
jgi:DNA-binding CsgD family transcriptional regulator